VATSANEDFARVVLSLGFCTNAQIERCLRIQSSTNEHLSLGQSLLREGFITTEQHSTVLEAQRKTSRKGSVDIDDPKSPAASAGTLKGAEEELLGRLLVREGWVTSEQMNACRKKIAGVPGRTLGDALVAAGYLDAAKLKSMEDRLSRRVMACPTCKVSFTVLSLARSKMVQCPKCRKPLEETAPAGQGRKVDPLATQTLLKALSDAVGPERKLPRHSP